MIPRDQLSRLDWGGSSLCSPSYQCRKSCRLTWEPIPWCAVANRGGLVDHEKFLRFGIETNYPRESSKLSPLRLSLSSAPCSLCKCFAKPRELSCPQIGQVAGASSSAQWKQKKCLRNSSSSSPGVSHLGHSYT